MQTSKQCKFNGHNSMQIRACCKRNVRIMCSKKPCLGVQLRTFCNHNSDIESNHFWFDIGNFYVKKYLPAKTKHTRCDFCCRASFRAIYIFFEKSLMLVWLLALCERNYKPSMLRALPDDFQTVGDSAWFWPVYKIKIKCHLQYSGVFDFWKCCRPHCNLKTSALHFSVNGTNGGFWRRRCVCPRSLCISLRIV